MFRKNYLSPGAELLQIARNITDCSRFNISLEKRIKRIVSQETKFKSNVKKTAQQHFKVFCKCEYICQAELLQKQSPRGVLSKRSSENIQQIYSRIPMPKCDFNKFAKQLY